MSNWYKESQSLHSTHDRFYYNVTFAIWVPEGTSQEAGWQVLTEKLAKITEEAGLNTLGLDAKIRVENIEQL